MDGVREGRRIGGAGGGKWSDVEKDVEKVSAKIPHCSAGLLSALTAWAAAFELDSAVNDGFVFLRQQKNKKESKKMKKIIVSLICGSAAAVTGLGLLLYWSYPDMGTGPRYYFWRQLGAVGVGACVAWGLYRIGWMRSKKAVLSLVLVWFLTTVLSKLVGMEFDWRACFPLASFVVVAWLMTFIARSFSRASLYLLFVSIFACAIAVAMGLRLENFSAWVEGDGLAVKNVLVSASSHAQWFAGSSCTEYLTSIPTKYALVAAELVLGKWTVVAASILAVVLVSCVVTAVFIVNDSSRAVYLLCTGTCFFHGWLDSIRAALGGEGMTAPYAMPGLSFGLLHILAFGVGIGIILAALRDDSCHAGENYAYNK